MWSLFWCLMKPFLTRVSNTSIHVVVVVVGRLLLVGWLLNIPATCKCISGKDLLRQFYVLPHWDRICRPNFPPNPVTIYWHWANQSQQCQTPGRVATGVPILKSLVWLDPQKSWCKRDSNPESSTLEADALTTRPTGRFCGWEQCICTKLWW